MLTAREKNNKTTEMGCEEKENSSKQLYRDIIYSK